MTKVKKKVFQPTQVDKLVFKVQDLSDECLALMDATDQLRRDMGRLEQLVGALQHVVNDRGSTYGTYSAGTTYVGYSQPTTKQWWKRWLGR